VRALAQTGIALRATAGTECASIKLTEKTHTRLCVAETEARGSLVARVRWRGGNHWLRRRSGINRPRERCSTARVPGGILGLHSEGVRTLAETGIALRARAGEECTGIQLT
jgi:hypothetical protein